MAINTFNRKPNNHKESMAWAGAARCSDQTLIYMAELGKTKTVDQLKQNIIKMVNNWGFSDFSYFHYDSVEAEAPLLTISEEQRRIYTEEAFYEHDLLAQYIHSNNQPIWLSVIEKYLRDAPFITEPINRNNDMLRMINSFGYREWYTFPVESRDSNHPIIFSVSVKNKDANEVQHKVSKVRNDIHALGQAVNSLCMSKFKEHFNVSKESLNATINPRPLQVLKALADGSCPTLKAVADKLNISIDTVNQHIATAKETLGAKSSCNAACIALKRGLFDIDAQ